MEKQEQAKPVRGQNLLEWYEALISAALVLVLIFSFSPHHSGGRQLHGAHTGER